jgi:hypothetical protein
MSAYHLIFLLQFVLLSLVTPAATSSMPPCKSSMPIFQAIMLVGGRLPHNKLGELFRATQFFNLR